MRVVLIAALVATTSACLFSRTRPEYVSKHNKKTLAHPAHGVIEDHQVGGAGGSYRLRLSEASRDRVCVDYIRNHASSSETKVLEKAKRAMARPAETLIFYTRDFSPVAPEPAAPELVHVSSKVETRRWQQSDGTGHYDTVCVEELVNRYGTVVGCKRYGEEEQKKLKTHEVTGVLHRYMTYTRYCAKNDNRLIAPGSTVFDVKVDDGFVGMHRFVFTSPTEVDGLWGARLETRRAAGGPRPRPAPAKPADDATPERPAPRPPTPATRTYAGEVQVVVREPGRKPSESARSGTLSVEPTAGGLKIALGDRCMLAATGKKKRFRIAAGQRCKLRAGGFEIARVFKSGVVVIDGERIDLRVSSKSTFTRRRRAPIVATESLRFRGALAR